MFDGVVGDRVLFETSESEYPASQGMPDVPGSVCNLCELRGAERKKHSRVAKESVIRFRNDYLPYLLSHQWNGDNPVMLYVTTGRESHSCAHFICRFNTEYGVLLIHSVLPSALMGLNKASAASRYLETRSRSNKRTRLWLLGGMMNKRDVIGKVCEGFNNTAPSLSPCLC